MASMYVGESMDKSNDVDERRVLEWVKFGVLVLSPTRVIGRASCTKVQVPDQLGSR